MGSLEGLFLLLFVIAAVWWISGFLRALLFGEGNDQEVFSQEFMQKQRDSFELKTEKNKEYENVNSGSTTPTETINDVVEDGFINEAKKEPKKIVQINNINKSQDSLKKISRSNKAKKTTLLKEPIFEINRVYRKSDIYKVFNVPNAQQGGKWRNGYCEHNNEFFIFANVGIPGKTDAGEYDYKNEINDDAEMDWEAQNGSKLSWASVQKLINSNPYIFVRYKDFRSGAYKFIGVGECIRVEDTSPVYFKWKICDYEKKPDEVRKESQKDRQKTAKVDGVLKQREKIIQKYGLDEVSEKTEKPKKTVRSNKKVNLLNKVALREVFNGCIKNNFNVYNVEENPFKIRFIHGKGDKESYWVFLKNISPAYFENPNVSRIQIANKPKFKKIHEQKELCIPIGYDSESKNFVIWNPDLFLERIINNDNISIYSRFSEQANLTENLKEFRLTNDEKVFVVNSSFLSVFLRNIKTYFKINTNNSLLSSDQELLFKYLSDVDDLLKSNEVLKAVEKTYEKHKDNEDFKNFDPFKDWFDLITAYKNHKL